MEEIEDHYSILLIENDSTDQQIQVAYRKLAKKYHPDKNKSAEAVVMFEKISKAQQFLLNPEKRIKLDEQIKVKIENKKKTEAMDEKRKRMKQDLDIREESYLKKRKETNDLKSKHDIELRNSKFKEEYLKDLFNTTSNGNSNTGKIKKHLHDTIIHIKWSSKLLYSKDQMNEIFSSYGIIENLNILDSTSSKSKSQHAIITFLDSNSKTQVIVNANDLKKKFKIKVCLDDISFPLNNTPTTHTNNDITTSKDNNNNNSGIDLGNLDQDEDDILSQMANFKKK